LSSPARAVAVVGLPDDDPETSRIRVASASEVLRALVPWMPLELRREFFAVLSYELAVERPSDLRERRIGLLYELIDAADGDWPGADAYMAARRRRARLGERWPTASQLQSDYLAWEKACMAAWRLWEHDIAARVPHGYHHAHVPKPKLTRRHAVAALHRFRRTFGFWPTQWEYERWARRLTGRPDPGLPTLTRISGTVAKPGLFGSWERALLVAVRRWQPA
jgi:hypothetical protein